MKEYRIGEHFMNVEYDNANTARITKELLEEFIRISSMVYGVSPEANYPITTERFEEIERALGFKLFAWQKIFINSGTVRRIGNTTAKILKMLLNPEKHRIPIDFRHKPYSDIERIERRELERIKSLLDNAGIATNPIAHTDAEFKEILESAGFTVEEIDEAKHFRDSSHNSKALRACWKGDWNVK